MTGVCGIAAFIGLLLRRRVCVAPLDPSALAVVLTIPTCRYVPQTCYAGTIGCTKWTEWLWGAVVARMPCCGGRRGGRAADKEYTSPLIA